MDYEAVKAGMAEVVPFNKYLGLEILEIGPGAASVRLPEEDHLCNHVGSQHAGALFSAGEAASGGAFVGAFAERMGEITPLAEKADIAYTKIARGPITASARLAEDQSAIVERLDAEGRTRFEVAVRLADESDTTVAEMVVDWYVRRNDQ